MMGMYGLMLIAAAATGSAVFCALARREGLSTKTALVLAPLAALLGAVCGRVYLHVAKYTVNGMGFWGFTLLSSRPYEYAACGVALGVMLSGAIVGRVSKQGAWRVLDALAPAGLLAMAVARFGEYFSDFGWGQVLVNSAWQFFPVAVPDMYDQWHLAVFCLEGLMALAVGAYALLMKRGREGDRFLRALLWWAATQILCESLRAETIRWGFVRVQQLQCAVFMLGVLLTFAYHAGSVKKAGGAVSVFALGVGVLVFVEYALDKLESIPVFALYGLMAAALCVMAVTGEGQRAKVRG